MGGSKIEVTSLKNWERKRMNIKKQLSTGLLSAVLGVTLIGSGTYAYFSDSAETKNTFAG
ncbi:TasA family protein [Lederbergia sp. NSJ-179]|uniref:TasA family protein n=1 Tax=Lederbergia sp. NSJ-179 TaxID=2931402 RepID=UPI0037C04D95